ncbi:exodeoxyribonuclease VII small subunit [Facklamia miroungae]|uniref:Exodeoxyribonuclease 7 small subunit n=1 Tax=Facklamia miroungae TaxID=120956 RepID=A0A1G7U4H0_9LACT|nr:exodeoxyribonuclease VII small subunit [Facklamia miroungae]NKZ29890.1 exodeoxyribonuclease VII small subunit [Facklamia miroungae]SDG41939.1 exodeoxyribonuclease VII small subunit [Facklamia miroungae]
MTENQIVDPSITFEQALQELEEIVQKLERGTLPLQEALQAFQKGVSLSQYCQKELTEAEATVTKIMTESGLQPLDEEIKTE